LLQAALLRFARPDEGEARKRLARRRVRASQQEGFVMTIRENEAMPNRWRYGGTKRARAGRFLRPLTVAGACISLLFAARAPAQVSVDCDATTDFCTGNPCTVSEEIIITVPVCNLDFGSDDLIINEKIHVPNAGTLMLKAASITVNQQIRGKHTRPADPDGADITLMATNDITINKRVDVSGRDSFGTITLAASGNIAVNRQLRARALGKATASGGNVSVSAGGVLATAKRGKIDVRGKKKTTAAGTVTLSGFTGADLKGRVEARGGTGGTVVIVSTTGNVTLEEELRTQGDPGSGGSISIGSPAGTTSIQGKKGKALANGTPGGNISISAAGNAAVKTLEARGRRTGDGGTITVTSGGDVDSKNTVRVDSKATGGSVSFSGVNLTLRGANAEGGKNGAGGTIVAAASNDLTAKLKYTATPSPPGCIALSAGGTLTTSPPKNFKPPFQSSCP
jgi:hypothetical protein